MIANNSWPWVWAKISQGMPQPGEGNRIVPNPPEGSDNSNINPNLPSSGGTGEGNVIVPVQPPPEEPSIFPWTSNISSAPAGTVYIPTIVQNQA